MKKTDKMIETRRDDSAKKTRIAITQINNMVEANEQVTVKELVNRTGFSRAFFYANEAVHEAILEAQEHQKRESVQMSHKEILDKTMAQLLPQIEVPSQTKDQRFIFLEQQNEKLRMEAAILRRENQELKELLREQEEQLGQRL